MARKKQSWRETPGYRSDSDEEEKKTGRDRPPIDKPSITCISRPQQSYDHPIFKVISRVNSRVNSMKPEEIVTKLKELGLSEKGDLNVTSKRLKNWVRHVRLKEANVELKSSGIDYLVVIDFEATCERDNPADFKQEIIEFPAVLVNVEKREIVSEFHSYCKPVVHEELTHFCTSLTGITQSKVEHAPLFPTVLNRFMLWLETELQDNGKFVVLTDGFLPCGGPHVTLNDVKIPLYISEGNKDPVTDKNPAPWDIAKFLSSQCKLSNVTLPHYFGTWSNIRRHFRNYYRVYNQNLEGMLNVLGMEFIGRQHSGIDDSRNIARIAIQLLHDGCDLSINETFGSN